MTDRTLRMNTLPAAKFFGRIADRESSFLHIEEVLHKTGLVARMDDDAVELEERSPVRDQTTGEVRLGSCTAMSVVSAVEHLDVFDRRIFSALAAYNFGCELEGHPLEDKGVRISTMLRVLRDLGLPLEADWPYDAEEFARGVPLFVREKAYDLRGATGFMAKPTRDALDLIESELLQDRKVILGCSVSRAFVDYAGDASVVFDPPVRAIGDHTVLVTGVRKRGTGLGREWKIQNTLGTSWGLRGYAWVSSAFVIDPWNEIAVVTGSP